MEKLSFSVVQEVRCRFESIRLQKSGRKPKKSSGWGRSFSDAAVSGEVGDLGRTSSVRGSGVLPKAIVSQSNHG
jgi:hypothetical protein